MQLVRIFARKQKLQCNYLFPAKRSSGCKARLSPSEKNLPSIKKTFEFFLLIQKKKCNFALNETKKYNNNH